jgi:signal transduction histidine kinase
MPDRLVELYDRLARKVDAVDAALQTLGLATRADLAQLRKDWEELGALAREQQQHLGEIARRTQELSSLSGFLQTDSEREKALLARELHDGLGGILTPARMDLSWLQARLGDDPQYAERMARLSALIDQGIDLKRRIIEELHPSLLDHLGLAAALKWYADEACRASGLEPEVHVSAGLGRLSPELEIAIYRLVQGSVANVCRHARATRVEVRIDRAADGLKLVVSDNGVGIEDIERARKQSHGLSGMSQRARALGGTFAVHSRKGEGTRVEVFVPLAA